MGFRAIRLSRTFGFTAALLILSASRTIAQVQPHGDTMLDISHSNIFASIIGCNVHAGDQVLINGQAADGVAWDRLKIVPSQEMQLSQQERGLLNGLKRQPAFTWPRVSLRLKPGYYRAFSLSVANCSLQPIPLVASEFYGDRHVTLIASNLSAGAAELAASSGFYGDIPILDCQVHLVNAASSNTYVAHNEDDSDFLGHHYMYFFDAVIPGTYRLVVRGFGWEKDLGPITVDQNSDPRFRAITFVDLGLKL